MTELSPSTTYWIGIKAADPAGNWSAISNVVEAQTIQSGGGGGGFGAQKAGPGGDAVGPRDAEASDLTRSGAGACAAEVRMVDGAPAWLIYGLASEASAAIFNGDSASILIQTPDGLGGWTTERRVLPSGPTERFAIRGLRDNTRYVFAEPNTFQQAWGRVTAAPGAVYQAIAAHHSRHPGGSRDPSIHGHRLPPV